MPFPAHNQVITFSRVPTASYCKPGVAYRVDRPNGGEFRFERLDGKSATFDRERAVARAIWSEAA